MDYKQQSAQKDPKAVTSEQQIKKKLITKIQEITKN